ncbi:MAG: glutamate--tRNA ligase family protein [Phycisphaeraceae bacterium]
MPRPANNVVTRFAPSPTGHLHIGGARTALFNWAFARRHGGTFILRIEDTDKARSTREATHGIIEDLQWLGIDWDEGPNPVTSDVYDVTSQKGPHGPYFQSQRDHLYKQYLQKLRDLGRVYDDAAGGGAVRFRMAESDITVHDLVLGDVTIKREQLEDFVIVKSDGGPTFHFANIVDDAEMKVTHVLRAQEHLMNTPKHVAMFDALGIPRPQYAHMPLIFNPDGSKMSKRDKAKAARQAALTWIKQPGQSEALLIEICLKREKQLASLDPDSRRITEADIKAFLQKKSDSSDVAQLIADAQVLAIPLPEIDVHDFRMSGYLPNVILNYIALLGWSPPDKDVGGERFSKDFMAQHFALEGIGKSNAKFDRNKLLAFNAEALQGMPPEQFSALLRDHLDARHPGSFDSIYTDASKMELFARAYQPRTRILSDPPTMGRFFVEAPNGYDEKAVNKVLRKNDNAGFAVLRELLPLLEQLAPWDAVTIHRFIEEEATRSGRGMGDIAQPLRVAVSGGTISPPINDTLAILGRDETVARIRHCLAHHGALT